MKRSFAEELADFATTVPADLDADNLGGEATLIDTDDELNDEPAGKRLKKAPERSMRMRADIDLNGHEYAGERISSAAAFDNEKDESATSSGSEEAESRETSSATDSEAGTGDEDDDDDDSQPMGGKAGLEEDVESDDEDPSDGLDNEEHGELNTGRGVMSASTALDSAYAEVRASDAAALEHMKKRMAKDKARGQAVRSQHQVWDRLLEARILLQKGLMTSRQLPCPEVVPAVRGISEQMTRGFDELTEELKALMGSFLELQKAIVSQNEEISTTISDFRIAEEAENLDGDSDKIWEAIDGSYTAWAQFRGESLDRWYRKTLLASGSAALKGNLRMLNQSLSSQVTNMMHASERLTQRSRLPMAMAPQKLCSSKDDTETDGVDFESYDDSDFYQRLLGELLESSNLGNQLGTVSGTRGRKVKSNRDRRASKGRKLRYDIQEKLVNFMTAATYKEPPMATQLFRNLFGKGAV